MWHLFKRLLVQLPLTCRRNEVDFKPETYLAVHDIWRALHNSFLNMQNLIGLLRYRESYGTRNHSKYNKSKLLRDCVIMHI